MGQIVSDDFNRANSTGLGANWTDVTNGFDVVSNQASARSGSDNQSAYTGAAWTGGADHYSEATIQAKNTNEDGGVIVRSATGAETFYYFAIDQNDSGGALGTSLSCAIFKVVAGAFTLLGSASSFTVSAGDLLRIEAQGTNVTAKQNGVTKFGPTSDSAIATGKPGLFGFQSGIKLDNFAAGDFSAGSTFPPVPAPFQVNKLPVYRM